MTLKKYNTKRDPRNNSARHDTGNKLTTAEIEQLQADSLKRMNVKSGQVYIGNDIRWLWREVVNGRVVQRLLTKSSFDAALAGEVVPDTEGGWVPLAKWFEQNPARMVYQEVVFDPSLFRAANGHATHVYDADVPNRAALNLFTGFAIGRNTFGSCDLFYDHLRQNYCNGDKATAETVLNWMAHFVQRPGVPIGWALAVVGDMGSGKSIVSDVLATIVGKEYSPVFTSPEQMLGKFNAALGKCLLARVEEAFNPRDPRHISTLKNVLSGGDTLLELKGVDAVPVALRSNVIFTSNSPHFLTAGTQGERRYFVFRCGNGRQQDGAYFKELLQQMTKGGYGKLLHDLLERDISQVDFTSPPRTAMLSTQIRASLTGLERWWADCLEAGELIFAREPMALEPLGWSDWEDSEAEAIAKDRFKGQPRPFSPMKSVAVESAASYSRDYAGRPPSLAEVGKFLINNAGARVERCRDGKQRVQRFVLPALEDCRAMFVAARPGLLKADLGSDTLTRKAAGAATAADSLKPPQVVNLATVRQRRKL